MFISSLWTREDSECDRKEQNGTLMFDIFYVYGISKNGTCYKISKLFITSLIYDTFRIIYDTFVELVRFQTQSIALNEIVWDKIWNIWAHLKV